jgi:hypothetical protein
VVVNGGALGTPSSGVGTNLTALNATQLTSGTIPAARTNGHQNGTATNDSAAAGEIGEYVESDIASGSAIAAGATTVGKNLTSISLTAGDWDVSASIVWVPAATTVLSAWSGSLSTTTGTADITKGRFAITTLQTGITGAGNAAESTTIPPARFSLSGTTTIFIVGTATYTTSTLSMYGIIHARRVR